MARCGDPSAGARRRGGCECAWLKVAADHVGYVCFAQSIAACGCYDFQIESFSRASYW